MLHMVETSYYYIMKHHCVHNKSIMIYAAISTSKTEWFILSKAYMLNNVCANLKTEQHPNEVQQSSTADTTNKKGSSSKPIISDPPPCLW